MKLISFLLDFVRNEEGQDLIEYALLVALIALVCVAALTTAGSQVNVIFGKIKDQLTTAAAAGEAPEGGARRSRRAPATPSQSVDMKTLRYMTQQLLRSDQGQDLIEYALLTALISVVAIAGVKSVGSSVLGSFWAVIAAGLSV